MKKNLGSKMKLTRETLHTLEQPEIKTVVAGVSVRPTCTCCNTTRLTCSTRYC